MSPGRIAYLTIAACAISCTNKKVEIVEEQKKLKKEIITLTGQKNDLIFNSRNFFRMRGEMAGMGKPITKEMEATGDSIRKAELDLELKILSLSHLYDSLEVELKKY